MWLADLVSTTGDWFSVVAVCALSAQTSPAGGGALSLAVVLAAHLVPQALLAPFAGWLADRLDRRSLLLATNLLEGALTVAMTIAAAKQAVGVVQVLLLLRSSVSALREPATGAAVPRLVEPSELANANTFGAATWSVSFVVGMALGGAVAEVGPTVALAVDAMSFLVATLLVARLPPLPPREAETAPVPVHHTLVHDAREATRALRDPELFLATFAKAPVGVASGAAWMALNLLARDRAFLGVAATLGLLQAVRGAGTGLGPITARMFAARTRPETLLHGAGAAVAVGAVGLALSPTAPFAFASALVWGMGGGAAWVLTTTRLQLMSAPSMRGRLIAIDSVGLALGMSGGAFVTALLVDAGASIAEGTTVLVAVAAVGWLWISSRPQPRNAVQNEC